MAEYDFTFTIEDDDGNELIKTITAQTKESAIEQLQNQLLRRGSISSVQEFEDRYTITRTEYCFSDAPWDDGDELEADLMNLTGVSSVHYIDPYTGAYGPPEFHLRINNDTPNNTVKQTVQNYFDGFTIEEKGSSIVVTFERPIE